MRYELDLILQLCNELGIPAQITDERAELSLGRDAVLWFQNAERDEDCLVAFEGTPWHTHDSIGFYDGKSGRIELDYLDIVTGLKDGKVLIGEQWRDGALHDRWLIHRDFNDEVRYMKAGEEIRIWRPLRAA